MLVGKCLANRHLARNITNLQNITTLREVECNSLVCTLDVDALYLNTCQIIDIECLAFRTIDMNIVATDGHGDDCLLLWTSEHLLCRGTDRCAQKEG